MRLLWLFLLCPLCASAADWQVESGRLGFVASYLGENFEGQFERFQAELRFDPNDLAESAFEVRVDLASVRTEYEEADEALPGPDWFDAARFPEARFRTLSIRHLGDDRYLADAELELRGVTRALPFEFSWSPDGERTRLLAEVKLLRSDFGVGGGDWADGDTVGLEVPVQVALLLRAAPP